MAKVVGKIDRRHPAATEFALEHVAIREGAGEMVLQIGQVGTLRGIS